MAAKRVVGIGLVGSGFMGRCHANAFRCVGGLFDLPVAPRLEILADVDDAAAERSAAALGFARSTGDWRSLVADPEVEIVAITAPNVLHEPIALAALEAGKAVYCEKPLSTTVESAQRMTDAAEAAGALTMVGFNYQRNPLIQLAKEIVASGDIGAVTSFRGRHAENYMASADVPHSFRTDPAGGGALADIGSHILSLAMTVVGPVAETTATLRTVHPTRPVAAASAERAPVAVDDVAHLLLRFANGAEGSVEANWAATGRTMDLSFEIVGERGAIAFSQERMNELLLWTPDTPGREGFRRIETGPAHWPYGRFCPAPGHHIGFNDLKVIEVAELLTAFAEGGRCAPDFQGALEVQRVVEAAGTAAREGRWVRL